MRKKLIAGNWKMHGDLGSNARLIQDVLAGLSAQSCADVAVCVPFPYLIQVQALLAGTGLQFGAQNISAFAGGAYTGEVSGAMLADVGCRYVIVGHSERRSLFGESDAVVVEKFKAAQAAGLVPILCVGETLVEREAGATESVVARQLAAVLDAVPVVEMAASVIAYEPVWAIGTGKTATPAEAQAVHAALRAQLAVRSVQLGQGMRIVYGGSMKPQNAAELLAQPDIDGGLIGGAALVAEDFLSIYRAC